MPFFFYRLRTHKQLILLFIWILFLGCSLWQHAQFSQQPPIYDAFSYYEKAHNFWSQIEQRKWVNPFNVEPTFRPPGTIVMSYPFGFDADYRGFYFRSTFLPIALFILAFVICGYRRDLDEINKWHLMLFTAFFTTMPCFYHFEISPIIPSPDTWGLVDNFLAGVAALATASTVRSVWTRSYFWLTIGATLASFCLLIKPTGIFVMMLVGLSWFSLSVIELKLAWPSHEKLTKVFRRLLVGSVIFLAFYLLVIACSFSSHYLSAHNLEYGQAAIVIMQKELALSWTVLRSLIHDELGYPVIVLFCLIVLAGVSYLSRTYKQNQWWSQPVLIGLSCTSCGTLLFGVWFWIFGSGGASQLRYFIPFVLMTAIFAFLPTLVTLRALGRWKRAVLLAIMIPPIINIGMLLLQRDPPVKWQTWTGVNLGTGTPDAISVQAQNFVSKVTHDGDVNILVYSFSMGYEDCAFTAAVQYSGLTMQQPIRALIRPVDWQRPTTFRRNELFDADYWLFKPEPNPQKALATLQSATPIETFQQEQALFEAWATRLTVSDGVSIVSNTPGARVLCITDLNSLEQSYNFLLSKHHWREIFLQQNFTRNTNESELATELAYHPPNLQNINFASPFFLRALSINRVGNLARVRLWMKPQAPLLDKDWAFFIHMLDTKGNIIQDRYIPIQHGNTSSDVDYSFYQTVFNKLTKKETARLAVGFYRHNSEMLTDEKGDCNRDNRCVIIPMP